MSQNKDDFQNSEIPHAVEQKGYWKLTMHEDFFFL